MQIKASGPCLLSGAGFPTVARHPAEADDELLSLLHKGHVSDAGSLNIIFWLPQCIEVSSHRRSPHTQLAIDRIEPACKVTEKR
jgi:hypothetical protein